MRHRANDRGVDILRLFVKLLQQGLERGGHFGDARQAGHGGIAGERMDLAIEGEQPREAVRIAFAFDEGLEQAAQLRDLFLSAVQKGLTQFRLKDSVVLRAGRWVCVRCGRRRSIRHRSGQGHPGVGAQPVDHVDELLGSASGLDHAMVGARLPRLLNQAAQIGVGEHDHGD